MFTGIIEEIGTIRRIRKGSVSGSLTIAAEAVMADVKLGDSIAVNGICLTVREVGIGCFTADVMHETFERSSAAEFCIGTHVNLERAMPADGRFGGHIVSGHIDGTGQIIGIRKDENAVWYEIGTPERIMRYIVKKGSVAVDGISLTVARVGKESFCVSVIPHTAAVTTLAERRKGDLVNLENDCIGKYVEKLLGVTGSLTQSMGESACRQETKMTEAFLTENGFL